MESHKVKSIMLPYINGVSLELTVTPDDKLTTAVKRMLLYNANRIAVIKRNRPIGTIKLDDALNKLGLKMA